jgi:hypothetical protein
LSIFFAAFHDSPEHAHTARRPAKRRKERLVPGRNGGGSCAGTDWMAIGVVRCGTKRFRA